MPTEASSVVEALHLADQRMYEHKTGRSSASRQSTDVLLQVISERSADLHEHLSDVARLTTLTAKRLELPEHEVTRIELHDVGLAGDAIPLGASIIAVCDAFDAIVTDRPYRSARSSAEALAEIRRCSGTQFDPTVVEAFCALAEELVATAPQIA